MPVDSKHPLYNKRKKQWEIIRDCYEGEDAIKEKGEQYLPRAYGNTDYQYEAYKTRARWVNYVGRTLNGLHGLMFRRYPTLSCPDELRSSGILENIDRRGTTLNQFVADSTHDMMIPTFGGFLVDMPMTKGKITKLEAEQKHIHPFLRYYNAESIINWKYDNSDGVDKLVMVVLKEEVETEQPDQFTHKMETQYRVLEIVSGIYQQHIYTKLEGKDTNFIEKIIPITINGEKLDYIPFVFAPSRYPDRPMLMDLAYSNIGHYQKSADYENGVHLTTIPTGYVTGHAQDVDEKTGHKETLNLGGDSFLMFPEADAKVGTLVYSGVGLLHSETALQMSMSEMAVLGSRLVSPDKNVSETADAAKIHRAGENALLATFAKNVSECISNCLNIILKWIGAEGVAVYQITTDYDTLAVDANVINALANISDKGKMPEFYVFDNLKNGEYLPKDASLEEYVTLLKMEQLNVDPIEMLETYRAMKNGEKLKIDWGKYKEKEVVPPKNEENEEKEEENLTNQ